MGDIYTYSIGKFKRFPSLPIKGNDALYPTLLSASQSGLRDAMQLM